MAIFLPKTREEIPFLEYTRKMRELSIIPMRIINYSGLWENKSMICLGAVDFLGIFCTIKCRHLTDQKTSLLRKLESMGIQLHRPDNLQLVQNCLCRIFWLNFLQLSSDQPKKHYRTSKSRNWDKCLMTF